jgi:hypothetical protein
MSKGQKKSDERKRLRGREGENICLSTASVFYSSPSKLVRGIFIIRSTNSNADFYWKSLQCTQKAVLSAT